jgi:hypothetical protein
MHAQDPAAVRTIVTTIDHPCHVDPAEVARYVGQMSAELAALARAARLDVLAYFLDMARLEALARDEGD